MKTFILLLLRYVAAGLLIVVCAVSLIVMLELLLLPGGCGSHSSFCELRMLHRGADVNND